MDIEIAALICVAVVLVAAFIVFRDEGRFSLKAPFVKLNGRFARRTSRSSTALRNVHAKRRLTVLEEGDGDLSVDNARGKDVDISRRRSQTRE